jgi:hypothetical protein
MIARQRLLGHGVGTLTGLTATLALASTVAAAGSWTPVDPLNVARGASASVVLGDGRVLVAGGALSASSTTATAELFDPATGAWTMSGPLHEARAGLVLSALRDGGALATGGFRAGNQIVHAVERFDAASRTWTPSAPMLTPRRNHAVVVLRDGRVLVIGGVTDDGGKVVTASSELYDPATGTWSAAGDLRTPRYLPTATLLPDGRVLVAGGFLSGQNHTPTRAAEVFDPSTGRWKSTDPMRQARASHAASLLPGGDVLVAGGVTSTAGAVTATAEAWSAKTGRWHDVAVMPVGRRTADAVVLGDGTVLIAGGVGQAGELLAAVDVYDPASDAWQAVPPLSSPRAPDLVVLGDGRVLAIASQSQIVIASVDVLTP